MAVHDNNWFSIALSIRQRLALPRMLHRLPKVTQRWRALSLIGAASLAAASIYAVSRPCVVGSCDIITQERAADRAYELLHPTATFEEVTNAYDLLLAAIVDLSHIPFWSAHHDDAQSRLQTYASQADALANLVSALRHGQAAALASQNAPHPLSTWQKIDQGWQAAIADLERVPAGAAGYGVAQRKLQEYQQNHAAIGQRIALEREAQRKVAEARQAAKLAESRAVRARSPEDWRHVGVTWQVVLNRLAQVDSHTMAYAEAQQLDVLYRPRRQLADEHRRQEQQSIAVYQQARALAQQAQDFEQQGQWSLAVARWTEALQQVKQVPTETVYHDQAQPLTRAYAKSLQRSQQGLQISTALQQAQTDLDRACQQSALCQYSAARDSVQVWVSDSQGSAVVQAMQARDTVGAGRGIDKSTQYLVQSMATLGTSLQVPVEFYDGAGLLIGTYRPDAASYSVPEQPESALAWLAQ
ncbi:MAG: hypothetical protein ACFB5Z_08550 [Elainellaceae cyanobacterium]